MANKKDSDEKVAGEILDVIPPLMRLIREEFRAAARPEVSVPQHRILTHIFRGCSTAAELAERQGVSLPAISKMIDSLIQRGFVSRTYKEGNRKQTFVHLTEKGRERYLKSRKSAQENLSISVSKLTEKEKSSIQEGLSALREFIQLQRKKGAES